MLVIECPHCGPRNSSEFAFQGKPADRPPPDASRVEWRRYLYEEDNRAGFVLERWFHVFGCRRFLDIERNNITNEIRSVAPIGRQS